VRNTPFSVCWGWCLVEGSRRCPGAPRTATAPQHYISTTMLSLFKPFYRWVPSKVNSSATVRNTPFSVRWGWWCSAEGCKERRRCIAAPLLCVPLYKPATLQLHNHAVALRDLELLGAWKDEKDSDGDKKDRDDVCCLQSLLRGASCADAALPHCLPTYSIQHHNPAVADTALRSLGA
jgi:hypothetical protein